MFISFFTMMNKCVYEYKLAFKSSPNKQKVDEKKKL